MLPLLDVTCNIHVETIIIIVIILIIMIIITMVKITQGMWPDKNCWARMIRWQSNPAPKKSFGLDLSTEKYGFAWLHCRISIDMRRHIYFYGDSISSFSIFSQEIEWISCIPVIPPFNESFVNWFDDVDGNDDNVLMQEVVMELWKRESCRFGNAASRVPIRLIFR